MKLATTDSFSDSVAESSLAEDLFCEGALLTGQIVRLSTEPVTIPESRMELSLSQEDEGDWWECESNGLDHCVKESCDDGLRGDGIRLFAFEMGFV